jgi:hypothetical protein
MPGFKPAEDLDESPPPVPQLRKRCLRQEIVHRHGDANLRRITLMDAIEAGLAHADDGQRIAVYHNRLADHGRIAGEPRFPVRVAQNGERMAAFRHVVRGGEHAPHGRADSEHGKVIARYIFAFHQFRTALEAYAVGIPVRQTRPLNT